MSITGMNLKLKTTKFGGEVSIFDSQQMRYIRGGATIDSVNAGKGYEVTENGVIHKIVPLGTFMAKLNGKYAPAKLAELTADTAADSKEIKVTDARPFNVGDKLLLDSTAATIASIDYATKTITAAANVGAVVASGKVVKVTDTLADLATPVFLSTETIDLKDGDVITTGVDMARVISARLPIAPTAAVKTALPLISFV